MTTKIPNKIGTIIPTKNLASLYHNNLFFMTSNFSGFKQIASLPCGSFTPRINPSRKSWFKESKNFLSPVLKLFKVSAKQ